MKKSLAAARREPARTPRPRRVEVIRTPAQEARGLSVRQRCAALAVSRATYDRLRRPRGRTSREAALRRPLSRWALAWPAYGYRRLPPALPRQGVTVTHKHGLGLMREAQFVRRPRQPWVRTTDSRPGLPRYPHLLPLGALPGLHQLWQADMPSIRLPQAVGSLAVLLAAYRRRCSGWALEPSLEAEFPLRALRMALAARPVPPGLMPHSEQGVQDASTESPDLLQAAGIRISMSRQGNPYDKAKAESFGKTLTYEEGYLWEHEDLAQARHRIGSFVEDVYNRKRLHSALGYRPPVEVEPSLSGTTSA